VFEATTQDPATKQALVESFVAADKELIAPLFQWKHIGRSAGNGWNSPVNNAQWGTDYLNRTAKPSPRKGIVYNVEPFRAGIRQGDWKLIWKTLLLASVELYNITQDPSEKNNVAAQNPDKVATLQKRANELAVTMAKPMLLQTEIKAMMQRLKMPPSLPADLDSLNESDK
jgi:hypothetical protein